MPTCIMLQSRCSKWWLLRWPGDDDQLAHCRKYHQWVPRASWNSKHKVHMSTVMMFDLDLYSIRAFSNRLNKITTTRSTGQAPGRKKSCITFLKETYIKNDVLGKNLFYWFDVGNFHVFRARLAKRFGRSRVCVRTSGIIYKKRVEESYTSHLVRLT